MSSKVILLGLTSVAVGVAGAAAILSWSRTMGIQKTNDVIITTRGLDEFGIRLEVPYDGRSPYHVLLVNNSQYHIIACEIVFEFLTKEGQIRPAHKVVAYSQLSEELDISKRKKLLKTEPGIAPHTKWMIAMGTDPDLVLIKDRIPALPTNDQTRDDSKEQFTQLTIKLTAVVLETGEAVGPNALEFLQHLHNEVLEDKQ